MAAPAPAEVPHEHAPPAWERWKPRARRWPYLVAGLWLATSFYIVPADQQAVVTRFGRAISPHVPPGLHISLPWPIDQVTRVRVRQMQRVVIGGEVSDAATGRAEPLRSQFLTGDQNLIQIRAVVQYSVGSPVQYLFGTQDSARIVQGAVESELARSVAHTGVDDILTTEKAAIQQQVRASAQRHLDLYGAGIALASVNIESVIPPAEAADAFRDVASARADSSRIVSEAQGYANDLLPRSRGEARQMMEAAEGHKQRVINQAIGDADRFRQIAAEYSKASEVNGRRLYIETLEQVLPRIKKTYVDGNVDLTVIGTAKK
jgi:membrane protease subunit HflK